MIYFDTDLESGYYSPTDAISAKGFTFGMDYVNSHSSEWRMYCNFDKSYKDKRMFFALHRVPEEKRKTHRRVCDRRQGGICRRGGESALKNYRRGYDPKRPTYNDVAKHCRRKTSKSGKRQAGVTSRRKG